MTKQYTMCFDVFRFLFSCRSHCAVFQSFSPFARVFLSTRHSRLSPRAFHSLARDSETTRCSVPCSSLVCYSFPRDVFEGLQD